MALLNFKKSPNSSKWKALCSVLPDAQELMKELLFTVSMVEGVRIKVFCINTGRHGRQKRRYTVVRADELRYSPRQVVFQVTICAYNKMSVRFSHSFYDKGIPFATGEELRKLVYNHLIKG